MDSRSFGFIFLIAIASRVDFVAGRSCNYNNLHALYGWSLVKSPGYPKQFPAQTQCSWRISAPPQYKIQLEITDFSLVEPNRHNRCVWQWLNVIDGIANDDDPEALAQPPMLTLCGTNQPRIVISSGNILRLNLHSNAAAAASSYRGFSARYKYTTEDSFMPSSMSNLLPNSAAVASPAKPDAAGSGPSGQTVGDSIAPFSKRAKPLPPNPNAVLTLKNKRTEAKNRARNEAENSQNNNGPVYYRGGRNPSPLNPLYERQPTRTIPTAANNIIQQDELPPRRGKPLPQEIKILLIVLGTVGAIALILYLIKKFAYDKAHKKSSGKIMHAYAHFRHFKKKKNNKGYDDEVEGKVKTISASAAGSNNGTLRTHDSSVATSNENSSKEQGHVMRPRRIQQSELTKEGDSTDRSMNDVEAVNVPAHTTQSKSREDREFYEQKSGNSRNYRDASKIENEEHNSSSGQGHHQERRRRKRRDRTMVRKNTHTNTQPNRGRSDRDMTNRQNRRTNGHHSRSQTHRGNANSRNFRHNTGRSERSQRFRNSANHRQHDISDYSSDDQPRESNKKSWRDRAYS